MLRKISDLLKENTLAVVLIAAIITTFAILSSVFPKENVIKFSIGKRILTDTINRMLTNDKMYRKGDLGVRPNGSLISGKQSDDYGYFCDTFAETAFASERYCRNDKIKFNNYKWVNSNNANSAEFIDVACMDDRTIKNSAPAIVTEEEEINFYEAYRGVPFGAPHWANDALRLFPTAGAKTINPKDKKGQPATYKIICMDIDGINEGVPAYGFGVRADGKILFGLRARNVVDGLKNAVLALVALVLSIVSLVLVLKASTKKAE